ncbi:hypothetical protein NPIL_590231 [Nephila pilipes]|uniref:Uncharacterized protein n=1 Tax=Nephila pilipes TaxID=299642 RepID=A0A8X6NRZ2_NEPPI|nr:hypothetical protein NPIL_590231 [Nephila pilipes]
MDRWRRKTTKLEILQEMKRDTSHSNHLIHVCHRALVNCGEVVIPTLSPLGSRTFSDEFPTGTNSSPPFPPASRSDTQQ